MRNRYVLASAVALAFATAPALAQQQDPQQQDPQQQSSPSSTAAPSSSAQADEAAATTTVVGCLYRERDVPGRQPNVAERAGVLEDYILAGASTQSASSATAGSPDATAGSTSSGSSTATGTSGGDTATATATGTSGTMAGAMYKIEKIADERLGELVGKRVEVTGRIDAEAGDAGAAGNASGNASAQADQSPGPDQIELPEFEATSIREVPGTCPATPAAPPSPSATPTP